jgi:hypothetical protein
MDITAAPCGLSPRDRLIRDEGYFFFFLAGFFAAAVAFFAGFFLAFMVSDPSVVNPSVKEPNQSRLCRDKNNLVRIKVRSKRIFPVTTIEIFDR